MLTDAVTIVLDDNPPGFRLIGGAPQGGDLVHRIVSSWPGWRRSALPSRKDGRPLCSTYTAPLLPSTALSLLSTKELRISWDSSKTAAHAAAHDLVNRTDKAHRIASGQLPLSALNLFHSGIKSDAAHTPLPHQTQAWMAMQLMSNSAILADDMGLGKTATALWSLQDFNRILIVCPASVKWNWVSEVDLALGNPDRWLRFVIEGTPKKRASIFADLHFLHDKDQHSVVIINYDLLIALPPSHIATLTEYVKGQALICDECLDGDTIIYTDEGPLPIREIVEEGKGQYALSVDSWGWLTWKRITRRLRHGNAKARRTLSYQGGSLRCTDGHSIYAEGRCSEVELLHPQDMLYVLDYCTEEPIRSRLLLSPVLANVQEGLIGVVDQVEQECSGKDGASSRQQEPTRQAFPDEEGWQRSWPDGATEAFVQRNPEGRAFGASRGGRTDIVFSGHRLPGHAHWYRDPRTVPQGKEGSSQGRAEVSTAESQRMDHADILERARRQWPGFMREGSAVYDLEVEETHNYFANGILVGNSHYLKSRKAERTKLVMEMSRGAAARLLLTGTPVRNTIEDLWTQLEIVAPGCYVSYHDFMNRHAVMQNVSFGNMKRPKPIVRDSKNVDVLNRTLNCYMVRRKKEDVLNLPPKIYTYPQIVFDGPIRKVYDQMKQWATIELEKLIEAEPAISEPVECDGWSWHGHKIKLPPNILFQPQAHSFVQAFMRLEQIAQGFLGGIPEGYLEKMAPLIAKHAEKIKGRPGELIFPKHPKLIWLKEAIETITLTGHQVGIFSRFNAPLMWLAEQYDARASLLHGGVPSEDRHDLLDAFSKKKTQIFLCQVKIAEGFNLTSASDVIFLGRDWSPAINRQAEDRFHRIGQKGTVNVQIPIVRKSIEELIHRKLLAKESDAQQALRTVSLAELKEALA